MINPFPKSEALKALCRIVSLLKEKKLKIEKLTPQSPTRAGDPVTLGSLIAKDVEGTLHTLTAVSGASRVLTGVAEGLELSPPVVSAKALEVALSENDKEIHDLTKLINEDAKNNFGALKKSELKKRRKVLTTMSLKKIFSLYHFPTIAGNKVSLMDIAGATLPPGGTGDCAEVKLLCDAFSRGWSVTSLCCISIKTDTFETDFSPIEPCKGRCSLVLPAILGLNFVFSDGSIAIINKSAGLLSIPGRTPDKSDCVTARFCRLFPAAPTLCAPHRLDMETSGLMALSFNKEVQASLCKAFEERKVQKEYEALLCGVVRKTSGRLITRQRVDLNNRPHQMLDSVNGKLAVTDYEVIGYEKHAGSVFTRVVFRPLTGRTHQLRVASAFLLNAPIAGDSLYGGIEKNFETGESAITKSNDAGAILLNKGEAFGARLKLHATKLAFSHPVTGKKLIFSSPAPF